MIRTFLENWPSEVNLLVYAEDTHVEEKGKNLQVFDLHQSCNDLVAFKDTWKNVPKANGDVSQDPIRSKRRDSGKGFKWDAVRFANKVYAVHKASIDCKTDWLFWMDADTICHSPITLSQLQSFIPDTKDVCFLGRRGKFSECGLYALNLTSPVTRRFLDDFKNSYDNAEQGIFQMAEWHDSYVFDEIRTKYKGQLRELDWAQGLITGEGHPLINSKWGAFLDHLKGGRKSAGKSKRQDLVVKRSESYWQQFK